MWSFAPPGIRIVKWTAPLGSAGNEIAVILDRLVNPP